MERHPQFTELLHNTLVLKTVIMQVRDSLAPDTIISAVPVPGLEQD